MRIRLDIPILLSEITNGGEARTIEYISTDTRELSPGDLFIPLRGKSFNGGDFIRLAEEMGATVLDTDDGELSLLKLSALYKSKLGSLKYTVGITGSVGKTTAKEFVYKIAANKYRVHKTDANENNIVGVAKSILLAPRDTELLVLEMGTNHPGEIERMISVIPPDIALITNIGTSHIGNFGSLCEIKKEKLSIAKSPATRLVTRLDDSLCGYTFSTTDRRADCFAEGDGKYIIVYSKRNMRFRAECVFTEKYLIEEMCAAISVCDALNLTDEEIKSGISSLSYDNTRQNVFSVGRFSIYSDCYNASYESFRSSFDAISNMSSYPQYSAVIGDIGELGAMSEKIHYRLGVLASKYRFKKIYILGDMRDTVKQGYLDSQGSSESVVCIDGKKDISEIADDIINGTQDGEIVLFKASRKMRLELIIDEIKRRCKN